MHQKTMKYERRPKKPIFVRARDFLRMPGANYIVKRNEFGAATYVVGKAYRKLSTQIEVDYALQQGKNVAQWGGKFFLYSRVTPETGRQILEEVWPTDERRGIPRPEVSDYDKDSFDI